MQKEEEEEERSFIRLKWINLTWGGDFGELTARWSCTRVALEVTEIKVDLRRNRLRVEFHWLKVDSLERDWSQGGLMTSWTGGPLLLA